MTTTGEKWKARLDRLGSNFDMQKLRDLVECAPPDAPADDLNFAKGYLTALELSIFRKDDEPVVIFIGEVRAKGAVIKGIDQLCLANNVQVFVSGHCILPTPSDESIAREDDPDSKLQELLRRALDFRLECMHFISPMAIRNPRNADIIVGFLRKGGRKAWLLAAEIERVMSLE